MTAPLRVLSHVPITLLGPLLKRFPDVAVAQIPEQGPLDASVRGEVLLTQAWGTPNLADVMARGVRWVHAYGTGVNRFPFEALGDVPLTCSRGGSGIPIAEWTLAAMLAFEKRFPESFVHDAASWKISQLGGLWQRTLAIVGFGGIGQELARRALAFGMRVRALRRSGGASPLAGVALVRALPDLVADADHVVIAAPATPETRHLIGREAFAHVKRGVHLVNVSRGSLVDQDALRAALDDGRVARATLDVAEPEPPPDGHWLYSHPHVRLSPHISWSMPSALELLLEPFLDNLALWQSGRRLLERDLVDRERGY
jgi:phosphoglycerate dehydrogenase-like enzyme